MLPTLQEVKVLNLLNVFTSILLLYTAKLLKIYVPPKISHKLSAYFLII